MMPCRLVRANAVLKNSPKENPKDNVLRLVNSTSIQVEREEKMRRMPMVLVEEREIHPLCAGCCGESVV
jgi:hypothetical protein